MVVGLLGNISPDLNRFTLVTPKSENDVRLQATLANQNPTGLPVGTVRSKVIGIVSEGPTDYLVLKAVIDKITGESNRYLSLQPERDMLGGARSEKSF